MKRYLPLIALFSILVAVCFLLYKPSGEYTTKYISDIVSMKDEKNEMGNTYEVSIESFDKLNEATYGALRIDKIIDTIEIIQYDVTRPIPEEAKNIECILLSKADPPYHVCFSAKDNLPSVLKKDLYWERDIQKFIKKFFEENPDFMFVDLGMNMGLHSLYATMLSKNIHVVAVEPLPENIVNLHKSAHLNNVQDQFQVVVGAVSDKRGPLSLFGVFSGLTISKAKGGADKSLQVNAITINDLAPLMKVKKALLKMDIEASECHVFASADKIFAEIDISAIIMEFRHTKNEGACCFESMLTFLSDRNYKGYYFGKNYQTDKPLNFTDWRNWNTRFDVFFKKFY